MSVCAGEREGEGLIDSTSPKIPTRHALMRTKRKKGREVMIKFLKKYSQCAALAPSAVFGCAWLHRDAVLFVSLSFMECRISPVGAARTETAHTNARTHTHAHICTCAQCQGRRRSHNGRQATAEARPG